jgi:hypothetical protein
LTGARHADADAQHVLGAGAATREQFAHQGAHAGQQHGGAVAHVGGFVVLGEQAQVGAEHGHVEAGRANVDAHEHAEARIQLEVLGAAPARGALQAGLGEQALVDQAGNEAVGLALGKAELFGHGMARAAGRPEGRFQQAHFIGGDATPTCHASCLRVLLLSSPRILGAGLQPDKAELRPYSNRSGFSLAK